MFYGWRIVGVCFLTLFVSVGFGFYSFGAFFKAVAAEFGGSRFGVGAGLSIFFLTSGLVAPFLGRGLERRSIRRVMSTGVVLLSIGFAVISRAGSLLQFYLALGTLMAVGAALIGGLPTSTLVANWFERRRGMALGVATMGISLSGVVMAPTATWLIGRYGWRSTFLVYSALTVLVILPAVRWGVVDRPEDLGQSPDGDPLPGAGAQPVVHHAPGSTGRSTKVAAELPASGAAFSSPPLFGTVEVLRMRNFWAIAVAVALNLCANGAILTHIIPHATDLGFRPARAALVLSVIAGAGVAGKVLFGWLADQVDERLAMWVSSGLQAIAVGVFLQVESYPGLLAGGVVFGLGMGGLVPLWGALIGAAFGRRSFGRVMGLMTPVMLPLQVSGVPMAGWVYDTTGAYTPAFVVFVILYTASIGALAALRLPPRGSFATATIETPAIR